MAQMAQTSQMIQVALLAQMAQMVQMALLAQIVLMVQMALLAQMGLLAQRARMAQIVQMAQMVQMALLAQRAQMVQIAQLVQTSLRGWYCENRKAWEHFDMQRYHARCRARGSKTAIFTERSDEGFNLCLQYSSEDRKTDAQPGAILSKFLSELIWAAD